jgi:hypothetical protein
MNLGCGENIVMEREVDIDAVVFNTLKSSSAKCGCML